MAIIDLFKPNRSQQFENEFKPYLESLYRQAYRLTGSQELAEDLVQELLISLYEKQIRLSKLDNPHTWLLRSLYNQFIDFHRRQQRNPVHLAEYDDTDLDVVTELPSSVYDENPHCHLTRRALLSAMDSLNPEQRMLVTMHDMEGFSLSELEKMLDTPIGTLKSRLHRSRRQLRDILSKQMEPFSTSRRVNS